MKFCTLLNPNQVLIRIVNPEFGLKLHCQWFLSASIISLLKKYFRLPRLCCRNFPFFVSLFSVGIVMPASLAACSFEILSFSNSGRAFSTGLLRNISFNTSMSVCRSVAMMTFGLFMILNL